MHAPARGDVAGSALAIAYKSDQHEVKPSDFVVFSVAYDSPARQLQSWDVPDLPACPNGKCMCSWFWIHKSIGGTDQMYMTPFVCNVTGATNTAKVAAGVAPVDCRNDQSKCVKGAKNPMYWKNKEGNNMPNAGHDAPTYSAGYGFSDGAQADIFNPPASTVTTTPGSTPSTSTPTLISRQDNSFSGPHFKRDEVVRRAPINRHHPHHPSASNSFQTITTTPGSTPSTPTFTMTCSGPSGSGGIPFPSSGSVIKAHHRRWGNSFSGPHFKKDGVVRHEM
jgi:hypothetical protein